ncbi:MFS transporter [Leucobacter sp. OLJS4]|uniref:MFS transporter n=1 Tax=unclassified Leucobacter TaxID=2621730 RepID=UPI000C17CD26|nr:MULTISPECIES: MFS transporter [unclassified Leucobacter]PII84771.1 MFS transporter [Leucobacter sp. OLCALW19]PII87804.1 MFS transporter [Leucobacter sp. OLTLW20]PII93892.1 MFS transporter [Leucobacter sp. OLAS13]PII98439.1 MFS transporter [Leucobacter sp. OLDS2]PIJ00420.1 MFS transporter [Leucobacter sp. OLCS4]
MDTPSRTIPIAEPRIDSGSWRELFSGAHLAAALVLAGGVAMYAMNTFFTAALLPSTIAEVGGSEYFAWVVTAFLIASVLASMLVTRVLGRFGAARGYLLAFAVFGTGTLGAALAPSMEFFLAMRVAQGLGGGLLAGLGYAVIRQALPEHLWTRATGLISAMWGVGTLIGPALGGLFAQLGIWRWAFALRAAVSFLLGVLALRALPAGRGPAHPNGRFPIASLSALVLAAAAFSIASIVPPGPATAGAILGGAALILGFVLLDRRASSSVLPAFTYRRGNPLKWIYLTLGIASAGAMLEVYLPRFGQEIAGLPELPAGLLGATVSVGWSFVQIFSVSIESDRGRRRAMVLGPVLMVLGFGGYALLQLTGASTGSAWGWAVALVLAGSGIGLAFPHLSVAALRSAATPEESAKAAAGVSTAQLISNAVFSALIGVLVSLGSALGSAAPAATAASAAATSAAVMGAGVAVLAFIGVGTALRATRSLRSGSTLSPA